MELNQVCNFDTSSKQLVNFKLCILCQENDRKKTLVQNPKEGSYENVVEKSKYWSEIQDGKYKRKMCDVLKEETSDSLRKKKAFWHRECYSWYTNLTFEKRAENNMRMSREHEDIIDVERDKGKYCTKRATRSSIDSYDKNKCFFCQDDQPRAPLYNLRSFDRSDMVRKAIEIADNEVFRIRFSSALDGHAGDMKYHTTCMITNVDKALVTTHDPDLPSDDSDLGKVHAAKQEILLEVENGIKTGICYNMRDITLAYLSACERFGVRDSRKIYSIRKDLKNLLLKEIDGIEFQVSTRKNEPELVYSKLYNANILDASMKHMLMDQKNNLVKISEVAKILRYSALNYISKSNDFFDINKPLGDESIPIEISSLIRWILHGSSLLIGNRGEVLDNEINFLCKTMLRNIKTDRQMHYKPKNNELAIFRSRYETSQSIALGLTVRKFGRRQGLVDLLHNFGFMINNAMCLRYETSLANEVIRKMQEDGCFIPANANRSRIIQFHLDNCDFLEDGPTGKETTHVLLLVGSQYSMETDLIREPMKVRPSKRKTLIANTFNELTACKKPSKAEFTPSKAWKDYSCYKYEEIANVANSGYIKPWVVARSVASNARRYNNNVNILLTIDLDDEIPITVQDTINGNSMILGYQCATPSVDAPNDFESPSAGTLTSTPIYVERPPLLNVIPEEDVNRSPDISKLARLSLAKVSSLNLPSYSGYNSVLMGSSSEYKNLANILMFPLIPGPANSYSAIYTAFMLAQNVTSHVSYGSKKTIIALDLDLYERALQLRNSSDNMRDQFILRLGELHIVFAYCRAIGRFIENTGIDDAWLHSDVVGPTTVKQVLTCTHMKRALIIHEATVLALYQHYYDAVTCRFPQFFEAIIKTVAELNEAFVSRDHQKISLLHSELTKSLESEGLHHLLLTFETERLNNYQMRMVTTYMRMFERLLLFIHATRSRNWLLHLSSAEALIGDLLSTDRIKYGRLLPAYIADMYALEKSDPVVWKAFNDGEFAVQKTEIPFVGLGMDHAGEQVNKLLKIDGGLIGVSKNTNARNRFMLTAPIIAGISSKTKEVCGVQKDHHVHHQLSNAYTQLQYEMVTKFDTVFQSVKLDFYELSDTNMRNFVTHKVFPDGVAKNILDIEKTGKDRYSTIAKERLQGDKDIFSTMPKLQIKLASDGNKKAKTLVERKMEEIKGYNHLFSRCAIVASQRNIDMRTILGNYELDVVPRSVMTSDGMLHRGDEDKSKIVEIITGEYSKRFMKQSVSEKGRKVAIIDAMVVVQKIAARNEKKEITIKSCKDVADHFIRSILTQTEGYQEVRIVFDYYKDKSLKNATRQHRGNNTVTHFVVCDNTPIKTTLEKLLTGTRTKQELTVYLAEKCKTALLGKELNYLISANMQTFGNIACEGENNHEEADTLIVWHCIHASKKCLNNDSVVVFTPDTDVLCMLVAFKEKMAVNVFMQTNYHVICIEAVFQNLGLLKAQALMSLHALSGCDTTGRLLGKRKPSWVANFMKCSDDELKALITIQTENPLSNINLLEQFICNLYCKYNDNVKTLAQARYYLFQKNGQQSEKLPPTSATFKQVVLRAHYQARIWRLCDVSFQVLPDPEKCGWHILNNEYMANTYEGKIAPDDILDLIKCNCEGNCQTARCGCFKEKLSCTDLCHVRCSKNCENTDHRQFSVESQVTDEELFESMKL